MNVHDQLLAQLGQALGLPLVFDANGQCLLMLDQKLMISIRYGDAQWTFYCMLAQKPQLTENHYWQTCLQLNLKLAEQGKGCICYEPQSDALLYLTFIPMPASSPLLSEFLGDLVDTYQALQSHVETEMTGTISSINTINLSAGGQ
ncbi:MAG: chaperone SicP [Shewanella sp.]|nr:chaperone SicP [Shewanella sp.]